jgi:hypothetical protein
MAITANDYPLSTDNRSIGLVCPISGSAKRCKVQLSLRFAA